MDKIVKRKSKKRRGIVRVLMRIVGAFYFFVYDIVVDDIKVILYNSRLFAGIALVIVGILSFGSGKYCDGNTSNYYACTRPSTYYYYSWWAIALIVMGSFSIVLWFLRKKKR